GPRDGQELLSMAAETSLRDDFLRRHLLDNSPQQFSPPLFVVNRTDTEDVLDNFAARWLSGLGQWPRTEAGSGSHPTFDIRRQVRHARHLLKNARGGVEPGEFGKFGVPPVIGELARPLPRPHQCA